MKQLQIWSFSLALLLVLSCNSDDDSGGGTSDFNIVGTWQLQAADVGFNGIVELGGQQIPLVCDGEAYEFDFELSFSEDPNSYTSDGTVSVLLNCALIGEQALEDLEFFPNGTWTFENGILTMTGAMESVQVDVEVLTNDRIILEFDQEFQVDQPPLVVDGDLDAAIELVRQ